MKLRDQLFSPFAPESRGCSAGPRLAGIRLLAVLVLAIHFAGCATAPLADKPPDRAAQAGRLLRKAQHENSSQAVGLYLSAAESALALATDKTASPEARTEGMQVYNQAVAECVVALQKQQFLPGGGTSRTFQGADATYQLQVVPSGKPSLKNPADFDRFVESAKISRKHLESDIGRGGLGGTLVGVNGDSRTTARNRPEDGFAEPITAIATFGRSSGTGATPVDLFFFDPKTKEKIIVQGSTFQLRGDFTAPLAYFPKANLLFGIGAMLRSDRVVHRTGIYFCEPYDPQKIPVLFVHGLMSSPQAWINFINELNRDPEFRKRYQPWVFFYPSGAPIAGTALRLREDLAEVAAHYPLKRNIIMVGHSMGGILTRMQVTNSKHLLWNSIFGAKAGEISAEFSDDSLLKKALIFSANPYVKRVIFIATPHLGSGLASLRISSMAASLIRLPSTLLKQFNPEMKAAVKDIDPDIHSVPTSIVGLSPKSQLLKGVGRLPIAVPYDCIIGNRGLDKEPLADSSDGVVPYWSSHVPGAKSETIVPTGHDAFNCPTSVAQVLRILKE